MTKLVEVPTPPHAKPAADVIGRFTFSPTRCLAMRQRRSRTHLEPANEPAGEGCPIHYYRSSMSIFVDPLDRTGAVPTFGAARRELPVLGAVGGGLEEMTTHARRPEDVSSSVHSYEAQSFFRPRGCGMPDWRQVGEKVKRVRPPKPERKPAIHGSSLAKKRHAQLVHDNPPQSPVRTTIVRGSSLTVALTAAAGGYASGAGLRFAPPQQPTRAVGGLGGIPPATPLYRSMGLGKPVPTIKSAPDMFPTFRVSAGAPEMLTLPPIR